MTLIKTLMTEMAMIKSNVHDLSGPNYEDISDDELVPAAVVPAVNLPVSASQSA